MYKSVEIPFSGHPDKVCDQLVEAILDEYLRRDAKSRVDIQALGSNSMLMMGGHVDSKADFDAAAIIKKVYREIGFDDDIEPFVLIEPPTEERSRVMVLGGAQGTSVVHGYATRETREMLPRAQVYASEVVQRVEEMRKMDERYAWLQPDGKVQVTMEKDRVVSVHMCVQHAENVDSAQVKQFVLEEILQPIFRELEDVRVYVNPAGAFTLGGLANGTGASGRKLAADTYGGLLPLGQGGLIGKDPLQPARCGRYMARYAAKQLVHEGVAGNVFVTARYLMGVKEPIYIEARGGRGEDLSDIVRERFDFRPEAIVERFDLQQPMYRRMAASGQFTSSAPWEAIEK